MVFVIEIFIGRFYSFYIYIVFVIKAININVIRILGDFYFVMVSVKVKVYDGQNSVSVIIFILK